MLYFPGEMPRQRGFRCMRGFSHRETGLRQAAARRELLRACCAFTEALAWSQQHFAAASSARLQSRQRRRAAGGLVPLGPCFPGLHVRVLGSPCQAELSRHSHNRAVACVAKEGTLCTLPTPGVGIAWPFTLALWRTRRLSQCFPHRKGEVTGSLHTARALNRKLWGTRPHPSP